MQKTEIKLAGAPNARDLGGIKTKDGAVVRPGRLIRSGMLANITEDDVRTLEDLNLRKIVDFRTTAERAQMPDKVPDGAEYMICPMFDETVDGITRDMPETEDETAVRKIKMARRLMSESDEDGSAQMRSLYPMLVTNEHSVQHYKQFFDILLRHDEGALLYHCTMGKDRVGVATALILSALGVHRDDIMADYMKTGERVAPLTERMLMFCRKYTDNEDELEFLRLLDTVQEDFLGAAFDSIERSCGSVENFIRGSLDMDNKKLDRFRNLYLD